MLAISSKFGPRIFQNVVHVILFGNLLKRIIEQLLNKIYKRYKYSSVKGKLKINTHIIFKTSQSIHNNI